MMGASGNARRLAYLPMQKAKYRLSDKWDPYLAYQPA